MTPQITEVPSGIHRAVPAAIYHAWIACSSTFAKRLVESSAAHAICGEPLDTPAVRLGTAVHARLLEPQAYKQLIAVAPDVDRRTKNGKERWAAFSEEAAIAGKTIIDQEQSEIVERITHSVQISNSCTQMLERCVERELSLVAFPNGTLAKCRLDAYDPMSATLIDIKTHGGLIADFARAAYNMNYAVQLAFYRRVATMLGIHVETAGFLVVETRTPPYGAQILTMPSAALDYADAAVDRALDVWKYGMGTGVWPSYEDRVVEMELPPWMIRSMEGTHVGPIEARST